MGTVFTGTGIELYRLVTLKHGLQLEIDVPGMKLSRHGSALKFAKQVTGLKTNDRRKQKVAVEAMIAALEIKPGDITST